MILFMINKKRNVNAVLEKKGPKYILKKGSKVSEEISDSFRSHDRVLKKREKQLDKNFILKKDMEFNSSSTAGEFVLGTSCNGMIRWKSKKGKTLKELV